MLSTDIKPNQMNTLSITPPASPLFRKDWEMEKSLLLDQIDEYKNYIHQLEKTHQNEKSKYQANQQNLLRQIDNKDKLIKDIENNYQKKIKELCLAFDNEKEGFKQKEQDIIEHYSQTMMFEQQKHERRYTHIYDKLSTSMLDTHDSQSQDHILTKVVEEDKVPTATKEQHCLNKSATASGFKQEIDVLQHRQMLMQCEARLENLIIEHQINIQDLQDAYGNEKEVMEIQYQQQLHQEQDEKTQITHRLIHAEEKVCDLLAESDISNKRLSHAEESAKKADKKCSIIKKEAHSKLAELKNLQRELHHASRMAKNILSMTDSEVPYQLNLSDLLNKISNQVVSLQTKTNMMDKNYDSPYGIPYYAF